MKGWFREKMVSLVGFAPHPPIIVPAVGRERLGEASATVKGMQELSAVFKDYSPELLVVITPHGPARREAPVVLTSPLLRGDFGRFGARGEEVYFNTDAEAVELLKEETGGGALEPFFNASAEVLDHGVSVPLYYLRQAGVEAPGLVVNFGFSSLPELYSFGRNLRSALDRRALKAALLASGDLSHCLEPGAPAGYNPQGEDYDHLVVDAFRRGQPRELTGIDQGLLEAAAECGLRSFIIALGAVDGDNLRSRVISYEAPFGVGYMVAVMEKCSQEGC